jgi:ubiquinone biosynthesis protein
MFRAIRNIGRLLSIGRTLARHDALFPLENVGLSCRAIGCVRRTVGFGAKPPQDIMGMRPGERLTTALQALGPSFIKLGQALSVRSDLVGEELADDLSALQDRLPPFPGEQAVATIEEEFGQPLAEIFSSFGEIPVAAASIAQVHFATTVEGDDVAVKVLRPGIEQAFAIDLDLLRWIAEKAERLAPASRRLRPTDVIETLAETVAEEMDLRLEAAAGEELRANFEGDDAFRVPAMDWTRTGRRVLTLERIDGIPVDEVAALEEAGHDAEALVANMARSFFLQVFRDGFFHADLHPGNILVADAVHFRAGYVPASQSEQAFAQAARAIAEPIMGRPLKDISLARLLAQLFMVTERFQMPAQPHLLLLQKTMLVAEGVGRRIYPDTNMWELARPLIESWMEEAMTPEARAAETMAEAGRLLERLPDLLLDMSGSVSALTREGLKLHPDTLAAFSGGGQSHPRWPYWAGAALVAAGVIAVL